MFGLFKPKPPEVELPECIKVRQVKDLVDYCESLNLSPDALNELLELTGRVTDSIDHYAAKWHCIVNDDEKRFKLNDEYIDDEFSRP